MIRPAWPLLDAPVCSFYLCFQVFMTPHRMRSGASGVVPPHKSKFISFLRAMSARKRNFERWRPANIFAANAARGPKGP
jgi:hypothetical protein